MSYSDPSWAHQPQQDWVLLEIKGGVEQARYRLDQACIILGRAEDQVDIVLRHESISRQHARIAFDSLGTPWLRDLQSTHGVTVNKKRLPSAAIGKIETNSTKPGSRGVVLYPGDILQFGASTRLYLIEGPEEFSRGRRNQNTAVPLSWKHQETEESSTSADYLSNEEIVPEQHSKEWEKINALQHKVDNLQTESERIRSKAATGELTAGQERRLEHNEDRISALRNDIEEIKAQMESESYKKINDSNRRESTEIDDDDDDFYDRTKEQSSERVELDPDGETEEGLIVKIEDLNQQQNKVEIEIENHKQKVLRLEQEIASLKTKGDEDVFFVQNDLELENETIQKLQRKQRSLRDQLAELKLLLGVLNPRRKLDNFEKNGDAMDSKPNSDKEHDRSQSIRDEFVLPQPVIKKRRQIGPDTMPSTVEKDNVLPPPSSNKASTSSMSVRNAAGRTLSFLTPHAGSSGFPKPLPVAKERELESQKRAEYNRTEEVELEKDEWRPPPDQDGSGITKINAKFAGRY
jgi:pSer/pThr/pTyr-binding forkhead associated (FHA) protein